MPRTMGYWDGVRWTSVAPAPVAPSLPGRQGASDTVIGLGYVAALLLPVVGLVVGVVVLAQGGANQKHGAFMLALSVVVLGVLLGAYV